MNSRRFNLPSYIRGNIKTSVSIKVLSFEEKFGHTVSYITSDFGKAYKSWCHLHKGLIFIACKLVFTNVSCSHDVRWRACARWKYAQYIKAHTTATYIVHIIWQVTKLEWWIFLQRQSHEEPSLNNTRKSFARF